jgi:quercetin dioxygenase-like cupin family protein
MEMIEKVFEMSRCDTKVVEKVIVDENIHYLHMIFPNGEGLPIHPSNANLYMSVVRGILSIGLNKQKIHKYETGAVIQIPCNTIMNVRNLHEDVLELIVIKSPTPKKSCL